MQHNSQVTPSLQTSATLFTDTAKSLAAWEDKFVNEGISRDLLSHLSRIKEVEIDWQNLYLNLCKIKNEKRGATLILRSHANAGWKLLCLTGQMPCVNYAIKLIKRDIGGLPSGYPAMIEALEYVAYSANIDALDVVYAAIHNKDLFTKHPGLVDLILVNTVYSRSLDAVKWAVKTFEIKPNTHCDILITAAEVNSLPIVKYAVEVLKIPKDTESSTNQSNILQCATYYGHIDIINYAIDTLQLDTRKIFKGRNLLHLAFECGDIAIIERMLSLNFNIHDVNQVSGNNICHYATLAGSVAAIRRAVELGIDINSVNKDNVTALHLAASKGNIATMQCAIALGANPDCVALESETILHCAASSGKLDALQYAVSLFSAEALAKIKTEDARIVAEIIISRMGVEGLRFAKLTGFNLLAKTTPEESNYLIYAARSGNVEMVQYLLEEGVQPGSNNHGVSILHMAALSGNPEMVILARKVMLQHGMQVDPHNRDNNGNDAYMYAQKSRNNDAIIAALLTPLAINNDCNGPTMKI